MVEDRKEGCKGEEGERQLLKRQKRKEKKGLIGLGSRVKRMGRHKILMEECPDRTN